MKHRIISIFLVVLMVFMSVDLQVFAQSINEGNQMLVQTASETEEGEVTATATPLDGEEPESPTVEGPGASVEEPMAVPTEIPIQAPTAEPTEVPIELPTETPAGEEPVTTPGEDGDVKIPSVSVIPEKIEKESSTTIVDLGECGDNLTWTLDSEGVLTISGTGEMTNYLNNQPWNNGKIKKIINQEEISNIPAVKIDFINQDTDFVQEEILNARRAFRKYVINNKKNVAEDIFLYILKNTIVLTVEKN